MEFSLKTTIEEKLRYITKAKGGEQWELYHHVDLYPTNSDDRYQLIYDGYQVFRGSLGEICTFVEGWCRIVDIENEVSHDES